MTELPQGTAHKRNAVFTLSSSVGVDATKMGFMGSLSCSDSPFAALWIFFYLIRLWTLCYQRVCFGVDVLFAAWYED